MQKGRDEEPFWLKSMYTREDWRSVYGVQKKFAESENMIMLNEKDANKHRQL